MKKFKTGFTLAEVLITLSVIGIISAIVLPSVIASYQYKTIGVKLQKFSTSLEQAARAYVVGDPFDMYDQARLSSQLTHFLNEALVVSGLTDGGANTDCSGLSTNKPAGGGLSPKEQCEANNANLDSTSIRLGGIVSNTTFSYVPLYKQTGNKVTWQDSRTYIAGVLKDGTAVAVSPINIDDIKEIGDKYVGSTNRIIGNLVDEEKFGFPVAEVRFDPNVTGLPNDAHQSYYYYITQNGYVVPAIDDSCLTDIYANGWKAAPEFYTTGNCATGGRRQKTSGS